MARRSPSSDTLLAAIFCLPFSIAAALGACHDDEADAEAYAPNPDGGWLTDGGEPFVPCDGAPPPDPYPGSGVADSGSGCAWSDGGPTSHGCASHQMCVFLEYEAGTCIPPDDGGLCLDGDGGGEDGCCPGQSVQVHARDAPWCCSPGQTLCDCAGSYCTRIGCRCAGEWTVEDACEAIACDCSGQSLLAPRWRPGSRSERAGGP